MHDNPNSAVATTHTSSYVNFLLFILTEKNLTCSQLAVCVCLLLGGDRQQLDAAVSLRHCFTTQQPSKQRSPSRRKRGVYPECGQNGIAKSPRRSRTREMAHGGRLVTALSPSSVHDASESAGQTPKRVQTGNCLESNGRYFYARRLRNAPHASLQL